MEISIVEAAEIVGAIGIILSLIYAGLGLRRNARAVRANAYAMATGAFADVWMNMAMSSDMTDLAIRCSDDFDAMNRTDKARLRFFVMSYIRRLETAYFQHKVGILTEDDWYGINGDMHIVFAVPGWVTAWRLVSNRSSTEFQAYIDKVIEEVAQPVEEPEPAETVS